MQIVSTNTPSASPQRSSPQVRSSLHQSPPPAAVDQHQPPTIHRRHQLASILAGAVATATVPSTLLLTAPPAAAALTPADVAPTIAPPGPLTPREKILTDVFARVNPSVVTVFDATLPTRSLGNPSAIEQPEGNGAGFIWDSAGHVITNYHVLSNALSNTATKLGNNARIAIVYVLDATTNTQKAYDGYFIGADKARDLAVLKINPASSSSSPITPIPSVGDAASLRIGQTVLAIGAPFGFDHTLTVGVVSALNRGFQSQTGSIIGGGIQIDASINPGNSGGPVVDTSGRLVGVSTAIFTSTGVSTGIGFALPAQTVSRVVPQLIRNGRVERASLGILPATDNVARALDVSAGVLIQSVDSNGPAASAGLLGNRRGLGGVVRGDVVVKAGGYVIKNVFDLSGALDALTPGERVDVEVLRSGGGGGEERVTVSIVLGSE